MANQKDLQIVYWPTARLKMYERNPRKNDKAVGQMIASITEFGFSVPILARSTGEVVDGHLRLKAALKMGIEQVPVILCDSWSEAQVKAFRLMVNRSVNWADWDMELLALEFAGLKELNFDLALTGFDTGEIEGFLSPDVAEEEGRKTLAERFGVPPFSVLDARQGYWQDRKRAWLSLGIQSELGRGDQSAIGGGSASVGSNGGAVSPGGSPRPACDYRNRERGDGRGRAISG